MNKPVKTFITNRSIYLKQILIDNGWVQAKGNDSIDFSYWDTYTHTIKNANIMVIPRKITNIIDNKRFMYDILLEHNLTSFLPITYINLKNLNPNIFNYNKLFFLKYICGVDGKQVYCVKSMMDMKKILENKKYINYILQEEVPNMLLHNGYKTSLRIYVLVTKYTNYIYKEGRLFVYPKKYCKNDTSNSIHNSVYFGDVLKYTDQTYYNNSFEKIKKICDKTIKPFFETKNIYNNGYIILGYDFILNKQYNPYLIEINSFPNLKPNMPCYNMLKDFFNLFIEPKMSNKKPVMGDWIIL